MKTNIYLASYEDLSQLSVNAETLLQAVTDLARIKSDAEPMLLQRKVTGIQTPDAIKTYTITVGSQMQDGTDPVPAECVVLPNGSFSAKEGTTCLFYATVVGDLYEFVCWQDSDGNVLGVELTLAYTPTADAQIYAVFDQKI